MNPAQRRGATTRRSGIDSHHLHARQLLGGFHEPDLGGDGRAGPSGEQERGDHRAEFAQHHHRQPHSYRILGAEARQLGIELQGQHRADGKGGKHDDDEREHAHVVDLAHNQHQVGRLRHPEHRSHPQHGRTAQARHAVQRPVPEPEQQFQHSCQQPLPLPGAGVGTRMEGIFNPLFLLYFFRFTAVRNSSFVPAPRAGIRYGGPAHQADLFCRMHGVFVNRPRNQLRGVATCRSCASARACARPVATLKGAGPPHRTPTLSQRTASVPCASATRDAAGVETFMEQITTL